MNSIAIAFHGVFCLQLPKSMTPTFFIKHLYYFGTISLNPFLKVNSLFTWCFEMMVAFFFWWRVSFFGGFHLDGLVCVRFMRFEPLIHPFTGIFLPWIWAFWFLFTSHLHSAVQDSENNPIDKQHRVQNIADLRLPQTHRISTAEKPERQKREDLHQHHHHQQQHHHRQHTLGLRSSYWTHNSQRTHDKKHITGTHREGSCGEKMSVLKF